jgi:glycosyltransferase involved in cell wall biosynthesis
MKLLLANHFALGTICGTTVMFAELLRLAPRVAPAVSFAYEAYEDCASADDWSAALQARHADAACAVAVNAHIEVAWDYSQALFRWCAGRGMAAYVYAHDYWPQHREALRCLTRDLGARVLASSPFVADQLEREGFHAALLEVGIPLPDAWPAPGEPASPKIIASAGRLVPRKRLADIVRGYALSGLEGTARLYLRALPSNVFSPEADAGQLGEIHAEIARGRLASVTLDRQAGGAPDYASYAVYVCSSSYEGFGMPVLEAPFHGCPPLMSDIPPHRRSAEALFGAQAEDFLFPVGDAERLASLLRDEILTARRRRYIATHLGEIRATIAERFSVAQMTRALAALAR